MEEIIDSVLATGVLLSTATFILARVTTRINLPTESVIYNQINTVVVAAELVKYLVFENQADYHIIIRRCACFVIMSTLYFFIALAVRTFGIQKTPATQKESLETDALNKVMHRMEELRHNTSTKLQNIATKIDEIASTQTAQGQSINQTQKDLENTIERLEKSLEIFKCANPEMFSNTKDTNTN